LTSQGWFGTLSEILRRRLDESKGANHFEAGQALFQEGDPPRAMYCVHNGLIKLYKTNANGERQILRLLRRGDALGFRALLADEPYAAAAVAVCPTDVCVVPRPLLMDLLHASNDFAMQVLSRVAEELRVSEDQMLSLLHYPVKVRLARLILDLCEDSGVITSGSGERAGLHRSEMAQVIGTTPETLSRSLAGLANRGIIRLSRSSIAIKDRSALERAARRSQS